MTLPELPEPAYTKIIGDQVVDAIIPYFTESQMLAYREQVIEMCAASLEKLILKAPSFNEAVAISWAHAHIKELK